MLDLTLFSFCLMFVALGVLSPFIWSLGYVWVDVLVPHQISYALLNSIPLAFIMGAGAVGSYLLLDRRAPPRITLAHALCAVMAVWITLTQTWAVVPAAAWAKWDPSVKVVIFTCFMPFVFRSRVQIEAYLLVLLFAAAGHLLPWGLKTLLTGGGYNQSLGLLSVNATTLAESSSVAAVGIMFVPLLTWMRTHSLLIPTQRARTVLSAFLIVFYLIATIGTFARTGLVGLAVLGGGMFLRARRKGLFIVATVALAGILFAVTSDRWTARISTVTDYTEESSALVRLLVWQWTLDFAAEHPLGGGFNSFLVNTIVLATGADGTPLVEHGRAFHNIYFAVLGEHGYPGLAIYVSILGLSLWSMQRVIRQCKGRADLLWAADLARAAQLALLVMMACGNFIDLSFIFVIWDIVALILCLNAHVHRVLHPKGANLPYQPRDARLMAPAVGLPGQHVARRSPRPP